MTRVGENPVRLPKRFYTAAAVGAGNVLSLDGRTAKTRGGAALVAPSRALSDAIADEWNAQDEFIDFRAMPMTRFAMTVIDLGKTDTEKWREVLLSFLTSDLVCYRASEPAALVAKQAEIWDPLLDWASKAHGVTLKCGAGISFVDQPQSAVAAGDEVFASAGAAMLLGMKTVAELSGSAVIALALAGKAFAASDLFEASRLDERFQAEHWGVDAEAEARDARLKNDFLDAARFLDLL
jgi:chaperone required for assembly of F1-ATPase